MLLPPHLAYIITNFLLFSPPRGRSARSPVPCLLCPRFVSADFVPASSHSPLSAFGPQRPGCCRSSLTSGRLSLLLHLTWQSLFACFFWPPFYHATAPPLIPDRWGVLMSCPVPLLAYVPAAPSSAFIPPFSLLLAALSLSCSSRFLLFAAHGPYLVFKFCA